VENLINEAKAELEAEAIAAEQKERAEKVQAVKKLLRFIASKEADVKKEKELLQKIEDGDEEAMAEALSRFLQAQGYSIANSVYPGTRSQH